MRKSVANNAVGHPAGMLAIEEHERTTAVAGTRILSLLAAGAQLLGAKTHTVQIQHLAAVLAGHIGYA